MRVPIHLSAVPCRANIDPALKYRDSVPHPCAFSLAQGWDTTTLFVGRINKVTRGGLKSAYPHPPSTHTPLGYGYTNGGRKPASCNRPRPTPKKVAYVVPLESIGTINMTVQASQAQFQPFFSAPWRRKTIPIQPPNDTFDAGMSAFRPIRTANPTSGESG
jgi:hypothetical protein